MEELLIQEAEPLKENPNHWKKLLFALFAIASAYLFLNLIPISNAPLGLLLFGVCLFGATLVFALSIGARPGLDAYLVMLCGIVFSSYHFWNGAYHFLDAYAPSGNFYPCFLLTLVAYAYFLYTLFKNRKAKYLGAPMLLEWVQAAVLYPFVSFPALFATCFSGYKRGKKVWISILFALIGLIFALLLGIAAVAILSFDEHFASFFKSFRFDADRLTEIGFKLFAAIPLGALMYGIYASSEARKNPAVASEQTVERLSAKLKFLPAVIAAIPVLVLLVIYGVFFFFQWPYYMSAFSHVLPEAYNASEYARKGFFELCTIAGINAALVLVLNGFVKRKGTFSEIVRKVLVVLLSLATLALIATALSKMVLYIERFDLTLLRLWPTFFLIFLAVAFLAVILSTFVRRVKVLPILMTLGLLFALAFPFCNVNRLVAKYNVDAYLRSTQTGVVKDIDIFYLESLGEAAVPELVRLYEDERTGPSVKANALHRLERMTLGIWYDQHDYNTSDDDDGARRWYSFSVHTAKARRLLSPFLASND